VCRAPAGNHGNASVGVDAAAWHMSWPQGNFSRDRQRWLLRKLTFARLGRGHARSCAADDAARLPRQ
jgi:hypothetical protein